MLAVIDILHIQNLAGFQFKSCQGTMLLVLATLLTIVICMSWRWLSVLEKRDHWTLRLRLALVYEYILIPYVFSILLAALKFCRVIAPLFEQRQRALWQSVLTALACGACVYSIWRLNESRAYRRLRWKAWTGPSRTGIPPALAGYLGSIEDWTVLEASMSPIAPHPVEKFVTVATASNAGIATDPTDLLKARARADNEHETLWVPRTDDKPFVYRPTASDQSVSLLWGEISGFQARCSRGIIAIPRTLLTSDPTMRGGLNGRPLCLAYAIVGRNKGLEPASLICSLERKASFRLFEENSLFWPRPAKTLRSRYREEIALTFSILGAPFVTAVTELALLMADVPAPLMEDWLNGCMEHQDIALNRQAAENGALPADLERLYRGHYAAMLVSLSLHQRGLRLRPELLIYDAVCAVEGVQRPDWAAAPWAAQRRKQEVEQCGSNVTGLIGAVV